MAKIHGATLNATVNPNGLETTVKFLFGVDEVLGSPIEMEVPALPAGNNPVSVEVDITNLLPETIYFFKVSATNSEGTTEGKVLNFLTPADEVSVGAPVVETLEATNIV